MDQVARLPAAERSALFSETAASMGTTPAVIEKDFWVTWVLDRLFQHPDIARLFVDCLVQPFLAGLGTLGQRIFPT